MLGSYLIHKIILTISIGFACLIGDVFCDSLTQPVVKAIVDNATHAAIAGLSWTLLTLLFHESIIKNIFEIFTCTLMSSLIDLDHFIEARSWRLSAATRLSKRPFLHSTTVPIILWILMMLISKVQNNDKLENYSWVLLMSFLSHHIRDATRRGLWFAPLGSTRPIPYSVYIATIILLPFAFYCLMTRRIFAKRIPDYVVYRRETLDTV